MAITNDFFSALNDPKAAMWSAGVAFNRSNPLPLDKWSVFQTMAEAIAYAETNAVAYPGQIIAVYDNDKMIACVLTEVEGKLTPNAIGTVPEGDGVTIEVIDGEMALVGFKAAEAGAQLVKGSDGKLSWVLPSNETVEGLQTLVGSLQEDIKEIRQELNPVDEEGNPVEGGLVSDVDDLKESVGAEATYDEEGNQLTPATGIYKDIEDIEDKIGSQASHDEEGSLIEAATGLYAELDKKADKDSVYTIEQTDKKIADAVAAVDHLKRIKYDSIEDIDVNADDADQYIYMIPTGLQVDDDKFDEYMVIDGAIEKVGSWEVDLKDYALKSEVSTLSQTVTDNKTATETAIGKMEDAIAAEKERAEAAELKNAEAIETLDEAKANKADSLAGYGITDAYTKEEVYTKSQTDSAITEAVKSATGGESASAVLADLNAYKKAVNVEVWGSEVSDDALTSTPSRIDVLEEAVEDLQNAEPYISDVSEDFQVVNGKLNLSVNFKTVVSNLQEQGTIHSEKIGVLEDTINGENGLLSKVNALTLSLSNDYVTIADFNSTVGNLEEMKANNINIMADLNTIKEILEWQEMSV